MSAYVYCPTCGYPNDSARGACLMCYSNVRTLRGGSTCPSCGADNSKTANFCTSCQAALVEGVVPQMLPDISALVGAAVGVGASAALLSDEYVGEPAGAVDFEGGQVDEEFGTASDFVPPPPPPAVDSAPEFTPAPAAAAMDLEEQDFGPPPPPPDTVDLDITAGTAPPPPPPGTDQLPADTGEVDQLDDWSLDYDQ